MYERSKFSLLTSAAALLCASMSTQRTDAQTLERLPPTTHSIAQLERLPRPDNGPLVDDAQQESSGTIRFAGGGIELQVPPGWWAGEVPFGREVRLVLAPQRPINVRKMPLDGMWVAYHAAPLPVSQGEEEFSRELSELLRSASDSNSRYSPSTPFKFGRWPAAVAEFTASESTSANATITGRHVLVRTEWGVFEFHASAPDAIVDSRSNVWSTTWESLRLNPPATISGSAQDGLSVSNSIIGDWKAYRSRMRFSDNGRVVIVPDALDSNRRSKPLTGTFEARDDLIFVRWDDGSRLNLRWRLQGNDLFLTDHEGQISHLKRVFN